MNFLKKINLIKKNNLNLGFTLIELIIVIGMISTLSGIILPSFINWIRTEKVNAYTRELREYFRIVRLEARRWGASCQINLNRFNYNGVPLGKDYYGYEISCGRGDSKINTLAPAVNNSIFQVMNKNFLITPNGRISSDESIVIVIGSRYYSAGTKILNCLVIQTPTGHISKGKFKENSWITDRMQVSQIDENNILNESECESS